MKASARNIAGSPALAVVWGWTVAALAGPLESATDELVVHVVACPDTVSSDLPRLASIELNQSVALGSEPGAQVRVECVTDDEVRLTVVAKPGMSTPESRQVSLEGSDPRVHTRIIALAFAEMVESHRAAYSSRPAPSSATEPAEDVTDPVIESTLPESAGWRVRAAGGVRWWPADAGAQGTLNLSLSRQLAPRWWVGGELEFAQGKQARLLGQITGRSYSLAVVADYSLLSVPELAAQIGVRGGWVELEGRSSNAAVREGVVSGPWGGPLLALGLSTPVSRRWAVGIEVESGWAAWTVHGEVANESAPWQELWGHVSLGVEWRP